MTGPAIYVYILIANKVFYMSTIEVGIWVKRIYGLPAQNCLSGFLYSLIHKDFVTHSSFVHTLTFC